MDKRLKYSETSIRVVAGCSVTFLGAYILVRRSSINIYVDVSSLCSYNTYIYIYKRLFRFFLCRRGSSKGFCVELYYVLSACI